MADATRPSNAEGDRGDLDWIVPFYGFRSLQMGPSGIMESHRARAASIERHRGPGKKRVLDLGAGAGGTAAAIADLGHDVVAIELEPVRAGFARDLAAAPRAGTMTVLQASYFDVALDGQFDVVGHWDSFGMGSDADQRRLLRRVAREWLAPGGRLLLDVFNPFWWATRHGQVIHREWCGMTERREYDPVAMRFIDTWWVDGDEASGRAQTVRCYSPADFTLLLEGTGLAIQSLEAGGQPVSLAGDAGSFAAWRQEVDSYLVVLARDDERE